MKELLITSTRMGAGKTSLGIGVGLAMGGTGYFKPLGDRIKDGVDEDAMLFKGIFDLPEKSEDLSVENDYRGILRDTTFKEDIRQELEEKYRKVSRTHELMVVESAHNLTYGSYANLCAPCISSILDIATLIVCEGSKEETVDKLAFARSYFALRKAHILGVVLNKLGEEEMNRKEEIISEIKELGLQSYGAIPRTRTLDTITVSEIADSLEAEILAGEEGLGNIVEHILVGAMTLDSAIRILQRLAYQNNAIITGGDRSDIQLLAFEMPTSCLILTGNVFPSSSVLTKADRFHIPVLFVPLDTVTTAEKVERVQSKLKYAQAEKLSSLERNIKKYVDLEAILGSLG